MEKGLSIRLKEYRKTERSGAYHFLAIYSDYKVVFGKMSVESGPFQLEFTYDEFLEGKYDPLVKRKFGIMRIRKVQEILEMLLENKGKPYIRTWKNDDAEFQVLRNSRSVCLIRSGEARNATWNDFLYYGFKEDVKQAMGKTVTREARKLIEIILRHSSV